MSYQYDVFGMCNALFDLQAEVPDEMLTELKVGKGGMFLISEEEQRAMVPKVYTRLVNSESGGSGANTMIGLALLGGKACYTSRVGRDEHGSLYRQGLEKLGVKPNLGAGDGETGICLVFITPDTQRTMCTFLGVAQDLQTEDLNLDDLRASQYLYITGYLWDTENQKEAVLRAMQEANQAGVKVALSLSDPFCVQRHKEDFTRLLKEHVDVVFANKDEAMLLTDAEDARAAAAQITEMAGCLTVVTMDKHGSLIQEGSTTYDIPVYPVEAIDTTGAGDMYAAGILYGLTQGLRMEATGRIAAYAAAQVVAKLGPRLESIDQEAIEVIKNEFR
jgi:Sugar kinases, ribokinase family